MACVIPIHRSGESETVSGKQRERPRCIHVRDEYDKVMSGIFLPLQGGEFLFDFLHNWHILNDFLGYKYFLFLKL